MQGIASAALQQPLMHTLGLNNHESLHYFYGCLRACSQMMGSSLLLTHVLKIAHYFYLPTVQNPQKFGRD